MTQGNLIVAENASAACCIRNSHIKNKRAFLSKTEVRCHALCLTATQKVKDGHSDRHAIFNLVEDDGMF